MIVVFLKYRDPMLFNRPNENFYEEEIEFIRPGIVRDAGILISEDDDQVILGETHITEDNPELDEWGVRHPHYRNVRVIH